MGKAVAVLALFPLLCTATVKDKPGALPPQLQGVAFDQNINAQVPLDLTFHDETGATVPLLKYVNGSKPTVLALVYYTCPMLCTLELNGLVRSTRGMNLTAGTDFDVVAVSINPKETPDLAAKKKALYTEQYGRAGGENGWHFLTGREEQIQKLTSTVGFKYRYDPETKTYAHASGLTILTPDGRVSRYFFGIDYSPRELRLALVEASQGHLGNPIDQVLLYCCVYNPKTGKYSILVWNVIRVFSVLVLLVLLAFVGMMFLRERRRRLHRAEIYIEGGRLPVSE